MKTRILMSVFLVVAGLKAQAFMTVQESAEIAPVGKYKFGVEPQLKLSNGGGFNLTGFFDAPISEETSARAHLGLGDTDFYAGGSFKWVPVPDYDRQPAVGGKISAITWREGSDNFFTFRVEPIASKRFETEQGLFIPYVAVPFMFTSGAGVNTNGMQVVGGTEYARTDWGSTSVGGELGINAKDSFSYISGYVTFYLEDIQRRKK